MPASEVADGGRGERGSDAAGGSRVPRPEGLGRTAPATEAGLRGALRRARVDEAERAGAIGNLHAVEIARLEVLRDRLEPVVAALPADATLFDLAVVPGARPRLFVDMIGFVEMAADRRRYRLLQDTRDGRFVLHEGDGLEAAVEAVTVYVARRLIERDKMLAAAGGPWLAVVRPPRRLAILGRLALEYLGTAALVVLVWVLGQALFQWLTHR